jgi:hypothetical protein
VAGSSVVEAGAVDISESLFRNPFTLMNAQDLREGHSYLTGLKSLVSMPPTSKVK